MPIRGAPSAPKIHNHDPAKYCRVSSKASRMAIMDLPADAPWNDERNHPR
jgi:hypothetical protein